MILFLNMTNKKILIIILISNYKFVKTFFYNSEHWPDGERQQPPPEQLHRIHTE